MSFRCRLLVLRLLLLKKKRELFFTGEFENFLNDEKSIFKCKRFSTFSQTMNFCGFDETQVKTSETIFKHENFQKNRLDLITKLINSLSADKEVQQSLVCEEPKLNHSILTRQANGDPCLKGLYSLHDVEKYRLNFETRLAFHVESTSLQKKIRESDKSVTENQGNVIELPVELFENPQESVSGFEENRCYAGFYGDAKTADIRKFFDDYLPVYANQEYDEDMFKDEDENRYVSFMNLTFYFKIQIFSKTAVTEPEPPSLEEASSSVAFGYGLSSESLKPADESPPMTPPKNSLEPLFTNETDEELAMEVFLKFNETKVKANAKEREDKDEDPDEAKDSEGIEEKKLDEHNFFNQYRESINLLYQGET